jgi:hypothetical protein
MQHTQAAPRALNRAQELEPPKSDVTESKANAMRVVTAELEARGWEVERPNPRSQELVIAKGAATLTARVASTQRRKRAANLCFGTSGTTVEEARARLNYDLVFGVYKAGTTDPLVMVFTKDEVHAGLRKVSEKEVAHLPTTYTWTRLGGSEIDAWHKLDAAVPAPRAVPEPAEFAVEEGARRRQERAIAARNAAVRHRAIAANVAEYGVLTCVQCYDDENDMRRKYDDVDPARVRRLFEADHLDGIRHGPRTTTLDRVRMLCRHCHTLYGA